MSIWWILILLPNSEVDAKEMDPATTFKICRASKMAPQVEAFSSDLHICHGMYTHVHHAHMCAHTLIKN